MPWSTERDMMYVRNMPERHSFRDFFFPSFMYLLLKYLLSTYCVRKWQSIAMRVLGSESKLLGLNSSSAIQELHDLRQGS